MRTLFHQYFRLEKTDLDRMLKEALISYDANVLLNIYRYSEETQVSLQEVFSSFVDRTLLPYQVAQEYARNRAKTIIDQVLLCEETEKAFTGVVKKYIQPKNTQPFLSEASTKALDTVMDELAAKRKALESMISEDQYADLFFKLFDNRITEAPNAEALNVMCATAADRIEKKIPPGYKDAAKEPPGAYGDYIAWRQLMDLVLKQKKDLIYVTDDAKEDWILDHGGRKIGPRPELLEEFARETGQRIWIMNTERFLLAAREAGSTAVTDSVIQEISEHFESEKSALSARTEHTYEADHDLVEAVAARLRASRKSYGLRRSGSRLSRYFEEAMRERTIEADAPGQKKVPNHESRLKADGDDTTDEADGDAS